MLVKSRRIESIYNKSEKSPSIYILTDDCSNLNNKSIKVYKKSLKTIRKIVNFYDGMWMKISSHSYACGEGPLRVHSRFPRPLVESEPLNGC